MPGNARPRIAIPMPHSLDPEYAERAIPQYERAVEQAGGEPVRVPLDQPSAEVAKMIDKCRGVLLPGSKADVDPGRFAAPRSPHTAASDPRRDAVDDLLLEDAYKSRKPVLGICYGLQSLNVYRSGSLIQHIPDFLPGDLRGRVNHEAGKKVQVAHAIEVENNSKLAEILSRRSRQDREGHDSRQDWERHDTRQDREKQDREGHDFSFQPALSERSAPKGADNNLRESRALAPEAGKLLLPVNSSHHQSADKIGNGLRISARCPDDGIIEALEGTDPDHFVLAVQWHPERSVDLDEPSRAIFRALIEAAAR